MDGTITESEVFLNRTEFIVKLFGLFIIPPGELFAKEITLFIILTFCDCTILFLRPVVVEFLENTMNVNIGLLKIISFDSLDTSLS
jgi:hypothetical protein